MTFVSCYAEYMAKKEKYKHLPNPDRVKAENERRRSSAATPQESRDKRLRTDERIIAQELKLDEGQVCPKCGSPTCAGDISNGDEISLKDYVPWLFGHAQELEDATLNEMD